MHASQLTQWLFLAGIAFSGWGSAYGQANSTSSGQAYPNKPVRIVTAAPGGGVDFTARLLALGLTANLDQQFVVDNRGGTHVAVTTVVNAVADGYTVLIHNNTIWTAPLLEKAPYSMAQLAPVVLATRALSILVVHPSLPVKNMRDLAQLAAQRPS